MKNITKIEESVNRRNVQKIPKKYNNIVKRVHKTEEQTSDITVIKPIDKVKERKLVPMNQ